jgi:hypothetical protein
MPKPDRKKPSQRRAGRDMTKPKFTTEQAEGAIRDAMGSMAMAAKKLKLNRTAFYRYLKREPFLQGVLDDTRKTYKEDCQEYARDNHLTRLMAGEPGATAYELAKMTPPVPGLHLDLSKLSAEEVILLKNLLDKARPDGDPQPHQP